MITNREAIYSALFDLLRGVAGQAEVKTVSRRLYHWADVPAKEQPACYQIQRGETPNQQKMRPPIWTLSVDWYVYVNTGEDPHGSPAILLNPIIDAIEACFPIDEHGNGAQTLGGLVSHAWINGRIETSEGLLGEQEVAIIPIEILTAE
jgi:hypothetical protein